MKINKMLETIVTDSFTWIGLGLIIVIILVITVDVIVIPTMITTILSLVGWSIYLFYVYSRIPTVAIFLGIVFFLVGLVYLFIIIKLRLWKWVAQEKTVPMSLDDHQKEIRLLNKSGVIAHTDLHPVGKIRAGGKTLDGLTEIGFIPRGTPLLIIDYVEGQFKVLKK